MDKLNKQYLKGFNAGYLLAEYAPKTLSKLLKAQENQTELQYMQALRAGKGAFEKERIKERKRELEQGESHDLELEQ